jgi:hypothetical protein
LATDPLYGYGNAQLPSHLHLPYALNEDGIDPGRSVDQPRSEAERGKSASSPGITRSASGRSAYLVERWRSASPLWVANTAANPAVPRARRIVTGTHGLIRGAKQHYETGYKVEDGQLLRPRKRLLVDVTASVAGLDKALSFANDLFNALESAGHRVCLEPSHERFHRPQMDENEEPKPRRQEYPNYGGR